MFLQEPSPEILEYLGFSQRVDPTVIAHYDYKKGKIVATTSKFEGEVTFVATGKLVGKTETELPEVTFVANATQEKPTVTIPVKVDAAATTMSYADGTLTIPQNALLNVDARINKIPEIHIVFDDVEALGTKEGGGLKVKRLDDPTDPNGTKIKFNDYPIKARLVKGFVKVGYQESELKNFADLRGIQSDKVITVDTATTVSHWWSEFPIKNGASYDPDVTSYGDGNYIHAWTFSEDVANKKFPFGHPSLKIDKKANPGVLTKVGQKISYTITVTNDGALPMNDVKISDKMLGVSDLVVADTLAPGTSVSKAFDHVATQEDLDTGYVLNTATTTGVPVNPDPQGDPIDPVTPDPGTSTVKTPGKLVFEKLADTDVVYKIGQKVTYRFKFSNTGSTSIYNIKLTDEKLGIADEMVVPELKPREVRIYEKEYTVKESDVVNNEVTNTATAFGELPGPTPQSPRVPTSPLESGLKIPFVPGDKPTPPPLKTGLKLEKTAVLANLAKKTYITGEDVGKQIVYQFLFTNTGTTVLKPVTLKDDMLGIDRTVFDQILPGESLLYESSYTIKKSDLDKASVVNTATGGGDPQPDPKRPGDPVPPLDTPPTGTTDTPVGDPSVPAPRPGMDFTKAADTSALTYPGFISADDIGKKITYTFTFKNTGNVDIDNVKLTDKLLDLADKPVCAKLAVGKTETYQHVYTITKDDIGKKLLHNSATVNGDPQPHPDRPNITPPSLVVPPAEVDVPVGDPHAPKPVTSMAFKKEADTSALAYPGFISADDAGKAITYRFTFENTGTTVIRNVRLTDGMLGLSDKVVLKELRPGESKVYEQAYTLQPSDIGKKLLHNSATVNGDPQPDPKQPNTPVPSLVVPPAEVDVPVGDPHAPKPVTSMAFKKEADTSALAHPGFISADDAGKAITYRFTFENTGTTVIRNVRLTDGMLGLSDKVVLKELKPGESKVYEQKYVVTEQDVKNGTVTNVATADGDPQPDPKQPNTPVPPLKDKPVAKVKVPKYEPGGSHDGGTPTPEPPAPQEPYAKPYRGIIPKTGDVTGTLALTLGAFAILALGAAAGLSRVKKD